MRSRVEVVEERVALAERELVVVHPRRPDELIDEEAFARDEFLPYWAELWPSGIVLARAVERLVRRGERVLELGCGLGIPSIAAALAGARVLATDWADDALAFAAENAARNRAWLETARAAWTAADALALRAPWDWVVAADVLYETRNVKPLLALLPRLGRRVLLSDPGRPAASLFFSGADGWSVESVPTDPAFPSVTTYLLRRPG